jgi:phosphatidylglycerol:prolipoprotein diacylglycerol transferase
MIQIKKREKDLEYLDHVKMIPYLSLDSFQIGPLKLYTWGSFLSLSLLVGLFFAFRWGKKNNWPVIKIVNLALTVYVGAILSARIFYFLQPDILETWRDFFNFNEGGLTIYGGIFGAILAGWFYLKKLKEPISEIFDSFASFIPLSLAVGRIGCFLINDHQGAKTNFPWAILWPDGALRHPVALYLILFDLALAGFLWWRKGGNQFFLFLFFYAVGRFFLDFTREPSADPHYWILSVSQWTSFILLTGLFLYFFLKKRVTIVTLCRRNDFLGAFIKNFKMLS